eukprot:CAMPEP_0177638468 /NCGR_PEP_ID=MMETSP0447-20121125/5504_1 /TAXON_ID=0 /ORGANISM="Stygamoeba regulata, Strain BSH-02190019" /LENGTH=211 /DNA_ID=CAMNT_0019140431 /DNA_START=44 /DNA_END=676 /DNA_ORIENTATION=-
MAGDWKPTQYKKFQEERKQPFSDLLTRLEECVLSSGIKVENAVDLGCGTGENTVELAKVLNCSAIGIDSSDAMISECKKLEIPSVCFQKSTIEDFVSSPEEFDVILANASLHWVPDHPKLLKGLTKKLRKGTGCLAFQVPTNYTQRYYVMMREIASESPFKEELNGYLLKWPVLEIDHYAEVLYESGCRSIDISERVYPHELPDSDSVVEW